MERLAWLEILDRHGDVSTRHAIHAWPLRIGRSYASDIIIDDPHLAADHLEITPLEQSFQILILAPGHTMTIGKSRTPLGEGIATGDDAIRIGQTQLRIRPLNHPVPEITPLQRNPWTRRWPAILVGACALFIAMLVTEWMNYSRADVSTIFITPMLGMATGLLTWSGFWALIGRVVSGRANFIAHTFIAALCVALITFLDDLIFGLADFAMGTSFMTGGFSTFTSLAILSYMGYRHMSLVSRMSRRKLAPLVASLVFGVYGVFYLRDHWDDDDHLGEMTYSSAIAPNALLLTRQSSVEEFLAHASSLKAPADKEREFRASKIATPEIPEHGKP